MAEQQKEFTKEEMSAWVKDQYQKANKYLAEKGVLFEAVVPEESRYIAPLVAIWKIKCTGGKGYWVIVGDLPSDYAPLSVAKTARESLRHFSLQWQLKAENILKTSSHDEFQVKFANLLVTRAEDIYNACENDELWGG